MKDGEVIVNEFYMDEAVEAEQTQPKAKSNTQPIFNMGDNFVQDIQQSVQSCN